MSDQQPTLTEIAAALSRPFDVKEVKFKPQTISGNRALAVPFVDARVIQDRLDEVLGVMGWQDSYEVLADGAVVCRLKIRIGEEWITKEDVGGQSEQPDEGDRRKAAFSDALKRAAVKFGLGRYLYRFKPQWLDYDPHKRQFTRQPTLPGQAAGKPATIRTEEVVRPVYPVEPDDEPAPAVKAAPVGVEFHRKLQQYDAKLAHDGISKPGDLIKYIAAMGKSVGLPADMTLWDEKAVKLAREETKSFEAARRPAKAGTGGKTSKQSLEEYDADLTRQGAISAGELKAFVRTEVVRQRPDAGLDMDRWADADWAVARKAAVAFNKSKIPA